PPAITRCPSGENVTEEKPLSTTPRNNAWRVSVSVSQSSTVPSWLAAANVLPSGENATDLMRVWPVNRLSLPGSRIGTSAQAPSLYMLAIPTRSADGEYAQK